MRTAVNERVTQTQIAEVIGVSLDTLRSHQKVREWLAEISTKYR
jgi:hypothetical protein